MVHQINWSEMPWSPVRKGVERKAFSGNGATLALHKLMPGHAPNPHSHEYEQIVYILGGAAKFHLGEESCIVEAGGLIVIPPNVTHWAEVIGDEPVFNLDVFTPVRSEYALPPSSM